MKSPVIKLLTAATLGLVVNAIALPANAGPGDKEYKQLPRYMDSLPQHVQDIMIVTTFGVIGVAVLVGTGVSMKHEKESAEENTNKEIANGVKPSTAAKKQVSLNSTNAPQSHVYKK